mmetsp:Transcript_96026/g.309739  ORF Transcript_96026/g.309739 Transcript_96026/m.309739 type:complete len:511 (+) Transcript_96026:223-1755(+)
MDGESDHRRGKALGSRRQLGCDSCIFRHDGDLRLRRDVDVRPPSPGPDDHGIGPLGHTAGRGNERQVEGAHGEVEDVREHLAPDILRRRMCQTPPEGLYRSPVVVEHRRACPGNLCTEIVDPMSSDIRPVGHMFVLPHHPADLCILEPIQSLQGVRVHQATRLRQKRVHLQALGVGLPLAGIGLVVQLRRRVEVEREDALPWQGGGCESAGLDPARGQPACDIPEGLAAWERDAHEGFPQPSAHLDRGPVHSMQVVAAFLPSDRRERHEPVRIDAVYREGDLAVEGREPTVCVLRRDDPRLGEEVARVRLVEKVKCEDVGVSPEGFGEDLPIGEHVLEGGGAQVEDPPVCVAGCEAHLVLIPVELVAILARVQPRPSDHFEWLGDWHRKVRIGHVPADKVAEHLVLEVIDSGNVQGQTVHQLQHLLFEFCGKSSPDLVGSPARQALPTQVLADDVLVKFNEGVHPILCSSINERFEPLDVLVVLSVHTVDGRIGKNTWHHRPQPDHVHTG